MTEREFWVFMKRRSSYESIPGAKIVEFGELLADKVAALKTKEAILMILAHHVSGEALDILRTYNNSPDAELVMFVELALHECEMWNE